jgi:hypothetical protein
MLVAPTDRFTAKQIGARHGSPGKSSGGRMAGRSRWWMTLITPPEGYAQKIVSEIGEADF